MKIKRSFPELYRAISSEFPRQGIKRPREVSFAEIWLRDGPLHIQGVLDLISVYGRELEGICLLTLAGHTDDVLALAVLPDSNLASGLYDNTIRVWDAASGACLLTLASHTSAVFALAVLPEGKLVSGSADKTIRV